MNVSRRALLGATTIATTSLLLPVPSFSATGDPDLVNYVPTGKPPKMRYWAEGQVLNQGNLQACEAFAFVGGWMSATGTDLSAKDGNALARYIFKKGGDPDGIAPITTMQVARDMGMVKSWTWIQTVEDLVDVVCYHGPASLGVRSNARFRSTDGREIEGPGSGAWEGHTVFASAYLPHDKRSGRGPSLRLRNSWGAYWGKDGSAWMTVADLKKNLGSRPYPGYYQDAVLPVWTVPN